MLQWSNGGEVEANFPTNFSVVVFTQSEPIVYRYIRIIFHRTDNTLDSTSKSSIIAIAESNLLVYNLSKKNLMT